MKRLCLLLFPINWWHTWHTFPDFSHFSFYKLLPFYITFIHFSHPRWTSFSLSFFLLDPFSFLVPSFVFHLGFFSLRAQFHFSWPRKAIALKIFFVLGTRFGPAALFRKDSWILASIKMALYVSASTSRSRSNLILDTRHPLKREAVPPKVQL